ncbi:MAG: hypothetical protein A2033_15015 [Bacteroidetes bacterium GWA2_31_9]|nr:MAG: hypothetical protein A2033_15015 [Bacteroidetes bacterium GWA2_31_9]
MINNKHTVYPEFSGTCSDKIGKGMIIKKRLATDCTTCPEFTSGNFHRFETTKGCFFCVNYLKKL